MRYLLVILLCISFGVKAQTINYQGNANSISGFKGGLLVDLDYYFPNIKSTDSILIGAGVDSRGKNFAFTRTIFNRWVNQGVIKQNLQQTLDAGTNLNKFNAILLNGFDLDFFGIGSSVSYKVDTTYLYNQFFLPDTPAQYGKDFSFSGRQIPSAAWVETLVTQSSFDTTMSQTVTSLTSPRFSRQVSTISYAGMNWNSTYFSQAGTTITLIGLVFYNNQKLTITLR